MTNKRRIHPADPDTARARADTQWIFTVFGKTAPKNAKLAAARTAELRRVLKVLEELKAIDDARDVTLPPMPALPVVMRDGIRRVYMKLKPRDPYTDNVKPVAMPRPFGKRKS